MDTEAKGRDEKVDILKGIAILLVVVGHLVQYIFYPDNHSGKISFRLIYAVHMPLFMLLSGYVIGMKKQNIDMKWLKRRAKTLVVPFLSWIAIVWFIRCEWEKYTLLEYYKKILVDPEAGGLWFLIVLFLNCVGLFAAVGISQVIQKLVKRKDDKLLVEQISLIVSMGVVILCICTWNSFVQILGSNLCEWYIRFYFLGVLLGKAQMIKKFEVMQGIGVMSWIFGIIYLFFACFWQWGGEPVFRNQLETVISSGIIIKGIVFAYRHLVPLAGIAYFICFVSKMQFKYTKRSLLCLGQLTIEIYLLQWYFLLDYTGNKWLDAVLSFGIIIIISYLCKKYISKTRFLGGVLFGKAK